MNISEKNVTMGLGGVALMVLGIIVNMKFFVVIGLILMARTIMKVKTDIPNSSDIVSGVNRSMPDHGKTARSSDSISYEDPSGSNYDETDNSNCCPICKTFSPIGYCSNCGYKFKR